MSRICYSCREENFSSASHCHNCGTPFRAVSATTSIRSGSSKCVRCRGSFVGHGPLCDKCKSDVRDPSRGYKWNKPWWDDPYD
jgi:hypothetical protein